MFTEKKQKKQSFALTLFCCTQNVNIKQSDCIKTCLLLRIQSCFSNSADSCSPTHALLSPMHNNNLFQSHWLLFQINQTGKMFSMGGVNPVQKFISNNCQTNWPSCHLNSLTRKEKLLTCNIH